MLRPKPVYRHPRLVKFHERLEWVRAAHGDVSLEVLADKAGLTRQALGRWMRESKAGKQPGRAQTLARCAKAWNVDLEWLQTGTGEPRPNALDALEKALAEEDWADAAVAAARAHHKSGARYTLPQWVRFLRRVHEVSTTSEPPSGGWRVAKG